MRAVDLFAGWGGFTLGAERAGKVATHSMNHQKEEHTMGFMKHDAIIVVSWNANDIERAHERALRIFGERRVSPIVGPVTNNYTSFFVGPDGSKESWDESDEGDRQRHEFLKWAAASTDLYGLEVLAVRFGGDDNEVSFAHN
jgi:hypothetical protein